MADRERRSAAQIEQDIVRTRAGLGLTIEALGSRLAARHLLEKGIDMISQSIRESREVRAAQRRFRADPIPLALIGFGLAWIAARNTGSLAIAASGRSSGLAGAGAGDQPLGLVGHAAIDERGAPSEAGWVHQAAGAARGALRTVRDTGDAVIGRAGEYAGLPARRLRNYAGSVGGQGSRLGDDPVASFERHPLWFGAAGILAGAALASLLPATQTEQRCLGEARERVWARLGALGHDAAERIRNSVGRERGSQADHAAAP